MSEAEAVENADNTDAAELAKFNALASRWWDPQGEFKPLHQINPLRLNWIREHAELDGKRVIDVGCGGGILSESMAQAGAEVTGIDKAGAALTVAKLHKMESGVDVDYVETTAEEIAAEQPESFDVVTCLEMLEHVPDPMSVIRACRDLVKPGGHVFFSTINRNPKSFLFAIVGAEYVLRLLPSGTHEYRKFIKPSELDVWARDAHLDLRNTTGMHYNPLTDNYWLAPNMDVNYLMHYQRPVGE
ncbi:MAG: bifunctional 2-polyprenyl-6-hydroxyphenol methylase/3-demethylubiquinol 3-O-methyltransferase UbiG [Woeseiaceae bacterium]|nr:bifunctional 2-polyprenyl-6-hydroxyphenol methylase/3-demethylubiquinol 3-O-methyltransferase UbiG [Woeseiaceae bacterium]